MDRAEAACVTNVTAVHLLCNK